MGITHKILGLTAVLTASVYPIMAANAFSLEGTVWERASENTHCKPDPLLLYSIALLESKTAAGKGMVAPHPFALRNSQRGAFFPGSESEARNYVPVFIKEDRLTDIGIMQINYRWNGYRVNDPLDLLDPEINIRVGAEILCEAISANRTDIQLAIGGYHTRNPSREKDARKYAMGVMSIWRSLMMLSKGKA